MKTVNFVTGKEPEHDDLLKSFAKEGIKFETEDVEGNLQRVIMEVDSIPENHEYGQLLIKQQEQNDKDKNI